MTPGTTTIQGMLPKVRLMLDGDGTSKGIILKLRDRGTATTLTPDELTFVQMSSPGILGLLRDFAHDVRSAKQVSDMFATVIAMELSVNFINEILENVRAAQSNSKSVSGAGPNLEKLYARVQTNISEGRAEIGQTLQGVSNAFMAAAYVRSALKSRIAANRDPLTEE